jgi:hypothetical protein
MYNIYTAARCTVHTVLQHTAQALTALVTRVTLLFKLAHHCKPLTLLMPMPIPTTHTLFKTTAVSQHAD